MNSKWKNKGLWISILAAIGLLMQNFGLYTKLGITDGDYQTICNVVLTVLVSLGIISNPSVGTGYSDNKPPDTQQ